MKKILKEIDKLLSQNGFPDALRMWVELGDIFLVKQLLGHSTVKTTEIYTRFRPNYLERVFNKRTEKANQVRELIGET